jgi:hypothetical protein
MEVRRLTARLSNGLKTGTLLGAISGIVLLVIVRVSSLGGLEKWLGFGPAYAADLLFGPDGNTVLRALPYFFFIVYALAGAIFGLAWGLSGGRTSLQRDICKHCAYDLTGNVSGVCPECGTPVREKDSR